MTNQPLIALKGVNGQLAVYDNCIVISRKGFLSFMSHGAAGDKTIPYTAIQSVQMKKGGFFTNGFLQFGIMGANERRGGVMNAVEDENAIVFKRSYNAIAERAKAFIEDKVFNRQSNLTAPPIPTSQADELLKLKQLLDGGAITDDEFAEMKKKLIQS